MVIYESTETEAAANAAYEESLFRQGSLSEPVLLLYRNEDSILFGRNQNPWAECQVGRCLRSGIQLMRRISGGGTVYQDGRNLNYCFLFPRAQHDPMRCLGVLQGVLRRIGVPQVNLRDQSSVFSGDCKLSGTAFALNGRIALLHGCILVGTDLARLHDVLSLGVSRSVTGSYVSSNRVPVTSLTALGVPVTCEELGHALVCAAEREYGAGQGHREELARGAEFETYHAKYTGDAWTYERCSDFEIEETLPEGLLRLAVSQGRVQSAVLLNPMTGGKQPLPELVDLPLKELDLRGLATC